MQRSLFDIQLALCLLLVRLAGPRLCETIVSAIECVLSAMFFNYNFKSISVLFIHRTVK